MYGLEQTPINVHGSDKNGGTVIYKINSVSVLRNPTEYEQALIRGAGLLKQHARGRDPDRKCRLPPQRTPRPDRTTTESGTAAKRQETARQTENTENGGVDLY